MKLNTKPIIVRTCKCHCGQTFNWEVQFREDRPYHETVRPCPKCGRNAYAASPWRVYVAGRPLREMDLLDDIIDPSENDPGLEEHTAPACAECARSHGNNYTGPCEH